MVDVRPAPHANLTSVATRARVMGVAVTVAVIALTPACPRRTLRTFQPITASRIWNMPDRAVCEGTLQEPEVVGTLESAELAEVSGVVTSPSHKGVLWMHNDSGDTARVFAVGVHGEDLGTLALPDVDAVDFEDIAAAPCPDLAAPCIYVADTGDNNLSRDHFVVYAFPEPDVDSEHPLAPGSVASQVWKFPMAVASGPVDIEALVILPDATAMILYEKAAADARIFTYRAPWTPDVQAVLEVTGSFTAPGSTFNNGTLPTGADLHPSGTRLAIRTLGATHEVDLDVAAPADGRAAVTADHFDSSNVVKLFDGPASEPQGEAIAWDEDGTGLFLVSESPDLTPHQPLHHSRCE